MLKGVVRKKMNMGKRISAAIAMSVVVSIGSPSLAEGGYMNRGVGVSTCGAFVRDARLRRDAMNWVMGFTTAINVYVAADTNSEEDTDVLNGADYDALELWLVNYCPPTL